MSNDVVVAQQNKVAAVPVPTLVAMVDRATQSLALARTPAEILDVKDMAGFAYTAAKTTGRLARAKGAHDDVITAVYRTQADALEIEAMAKRRLADEYDEAQKRGEVRTKQDAYKSRDQVGLGDLTPAPPTAAEVGLTKYVVADARKIRDADIADPGFIRRELDEMLLSGVEPTKEAINRAAATRLGAYSGDNEWYTPARYVDLARSVMGTIDVDPASNDHAQKTVKAATFYTAETDGLDKDWHGKVWMNPPYSNPEVQRFTEKVAEEYLSGRVTEAIILTNNAGDTAWHHALAEVSSAMCITRGRIRFESPTRAGNSPAMGQSFFYLGPNVAHFASLFGEVGRITTNYHVAVARALPGNDNACTDSAAA